MERTITEVPEIFFARRFIKTHPSLGEADLRHALTYGLWFLPNPENSNHLVGMGTTGHKGSPTSIFIGDQTKSFKVFSKPFMDYFYAEREFNNAQIAVTRRISTPEMIALMKIGDEEAILVSELMENVLPLSAYRLDQRLKDPRIYTPRDFLKTFMSFLAKSHNKGVVYGDLHLGNIGFQFRKFTPPKPIVFDLETATVLSDDMMLRKANGNFTDPHQKTQFEMFERGAIDDVALLITHFVKNGFPIKGGELLVECSSIYDDNRAKSFSVNSGPDLLIRLAEKHKSFLKILNP